MSGLQKRKGRFERDAQGFLDLGQRISDMLTPHLDLMLSWLVGPLVLPLRSLEWPNLLPAEANCPVRL